MGVYEDVAIADMKFDGELYTYLCPVSYTHLTLPTKA